MQLSRTGFMDCDSLKSGPGGFVFTLIPAANTNGHHKAATILALEAVASLPPERRPAVFGVELATMIGSLESELADC